MQNNPDLWMESFPKRLKDAHKYDNGHAVIYGAPQLTGATRLAATACARIGAGLTTVLSNKDVFDIFRCTLPAHIMVRDDLQWNDHRVSAKLYGCGGMPVSPNYDEAVATVLDADALHNLPEKLGRHFVLTPHEGEFARAFPDIDGTKEERACQAAMRSDSIIVLKGSHTIIAHPDGRFVSNAHASPHLASAGSGDVLAGVITGLMAQGMQPFEAACAGVWIHGDAGIRLGAGMVASDLSEIIPEIMQNLT